MREDSRVLNCLAIADCIGMIGETPPLQAEAGNHSRYLVIFHLTSTHDGTQDASVMGSGGHTFYRGLYIPPNQEGLARSMRWKEFKELKPLTT